MFLWSRWTGSWNWTGIHNPNYELRNLYCSGAARREDTDDKPVSRDSRTGEFAAALRWTKRDVVGLRKEIEECT